MTVGEPLRDPAFDAAQVQLELLSDRDAILDAFFAYGCAVFKFAVLFVVRGEAAHGRDVHGLGAPSGLVARLVFPLEKGGILAKAVAYKKTFVGTPAADGEDADLVGQLGRAMPTCVVAPVVVRGRVVAILLGEGMSEATAQRARAAEQPPLELARESMFAWTDCVGDAFERLIVRRKSDDGGVVASMRRPPSSRDSFSFRDLPPASTRPPPRPSRVWIAPAALALLIGGGLVFRYTRPEVGPESIVAAGGELPGFPGEVDLGAALDRARDVAALPGGDLVGIETELGRGGAIDVGATSSAAETPRLAFFFATGDAEAEVRVDAAGVHGPQRRPRAECDGRPCRAAVSRPACSTAQLWDAAVALGVTGEDRLRASYAATGGNGPQWSLAIAQRGSVTLDGATCKPLSRERIRPPRAPITAVPGAPKAVDPALALDVARRQAGLGPDARLLEIEAIGVGADGKVDLTAGGARIVYRFADADGVPMPERRWRQVILTADGMPITPIASEREALPIRVKGPVASPRCGFAAVFALGALPPDVKARVIYGADSSFPEAGQWTLEAPSMSARIVRSDMSCAATSGSPGPGSASTSGAPRAP